MNSRSGFCPGCGAQVYPEEVHCPFCGRKLHNDFVKPFLMGLGGAVVALICGGMVWWALSGPVEAPADGASVTAAVPADPTPAPDASAAAPPAAPGPASAPSATASVGPAAGASSTKDQQAFVPGAGRQAALPPGANAYAPAGPQAGVDPAEAQTPLPTVNHPLAPPPADAAARKAFAKAKQDSFVQNGLDLTVATSGPEGTTLTIKFNFPAKNAAELIVAGPFPRQCEQRGFRQILFVDPTGATWAYDLTSRELTQK